MFTNKRKPPVMAIRIPPVLVTSLLGLSLVSAQQPARTDRIFQRLDKNRDGVITRDEAPGDTAFNGADANGDGRVTREELARRSQRPGVGRATGNLDGPLPEDASQADTDFQLAYVHNGRIAQESLTSLRSAIVHHIGKRTSAI